MKLERSVLGYDISAVAERLGPDLMVTVTGGCAPHVGSVSLAWFEDGAVFTQSAFRPAHKDHIVGESYAEKLAGALRCGVSVTCGIHYDGVSADQIKLIVACADELLAELLEKLLAASA